MNKRGNGRENFKELDTMAWYMVAPKESLTMYKNTVSPYLLVEQGPEHGEWNIQEHHPRNHLNLRDKPRLWLE